LIKYFAVENFRSIKEENIVEFDAGLSKESPFIANPTIGIAGANASGKSSLLQALNFTLWFMQDSFLSLDEGKNIPIEPFITCKNRPTKLHIIFSQAIQVDSIHKQVDFEYVLCLTRQKVITETLLAYPYRRKRLVYQRTENKIKQGSKIPKLDLEVWSNLRPNCSVVSFAAQFNSQTTAKNCKNFLFESNLSGKGTVEYEFDSSVLGSLIEKYDFSKQEIVSLFKIADLGIEDFEFIKSSKYKSNLGNWVRKFIRTQISASEDSNDDQDNVHYVLDYEKIFQSMFGIKNRRELKETDNDILFIKHRVDDDMFDFDYSLESSGTLQFFIILNKVMLALKQGSVFIFDEIEIKLHQNLVAYIIGLFQNKYENSNGAQLIFSFHNTYFMDILEPNQLWFTEKNDRGQTKIFSAADFKDIKKLQQRSLEELYRLGRFGAKPRGI